MKKSERVISVISGVKSSLQFETLRSTPFHVMCAKEGYSFFNGEKELLLPMTSFVSANRCNYINRDNHSSKIVSDMIIYGRNSNVIGFSDYYGSSIGDIYCEYGCVYTKTGGIYCLSMKNSMSNDILVVNKMFRNDELVKYIIKSFLSSLHTCYDEIIIGSTMNYITVK